MRYTLLLVPLIFGAFNFIIKTTGAQVSAFPSVSIEQLTNLAKQGNAVAQNNLGLRFARGDQVQQNHKTALKWYRLAAEQGLPEAQNNVGLMYVEGMGTPQDDVTAIRWYRLAAIQNFAVAQNNLGWMYDQGRGVGKNYKEATKWYRRAAQQGLPNAQFNLAAMYEAGFGIHQDSVEALRWYRKAAAQNHKHAKVRVVILAQREPVTVKTLEESTEKIREESNLLASTLQQKTKNDAQSPSPLTVISPTTNPVTKFAYRVQLAAYRNTDYSQKSWRAMVNSYPEIFKGLEPVIKRVDLGLNKGIFFRLMTGAFASRKQAVKFCTRIMDTGVSTGCIVRKIHK